MKIRNVANYNLEVIHFLDKHGVTVIDAAKTIGITKQCFYYRLRNGRFKNEDFDKLKAAYKNKRPKTRRNLALIHCLDLHGLTIADVARALHISRQALHSKINGEISFADDEIKTIAALVNMQPYDLVMQIIGGNHRGKRP